MNDVRTPWRRIDSLRDGLLDSVHLLKARRAGDIPAGFIDDYVALSWLEWHGGALRLTTVGENIARQISLQPRHAGPAGRAKAAAVAR